MPSPQLLTQLNQVFAASKSFQAMSAEDQAKVRAKYANASDEEVMNALKVMAQEKIFSDELDAKQAQISVQKAEAVTDLKQASKRAERMSLHDDEMEETESTDKEADALLKQIGADKDRKKKKLFGIF